MKRCVFSKTGSSFPHEIDKGEFTESDLFVPVVTSRCLFLDFVDFTRGVLLTLSDLVFVDCLISLIV